MFNFSKSRLDSDLQNKTTVQHKVLCDWLRTLHTDNVQLKRQLTILDKRISRLLEDDSPPDNIESNFDNNVEKSYDDSSSARGV